MIGETLRAAGDLERIGGWEYLQQLARSEATSYSIASYAKIVKDLAFNRDIAHKASRIMGLAMERVSKDALIGEIQRLLKPALEEATAEDEDEDRVLKPLDLGALYDVVDEFDRQPWVWDQILPRQSLSLFVGKSESGKSTIIYSLIYAIVMGRKFFGRLCERGRVIYLAGDPMAEIVAGKTFRELGLGPDEGVNVLPGALVNNPTAMPQLRRIVREFQPSLIVGDTLAATIQLDTDSYGKSYASQQPLGKMARDSGANFLMAHHSQKSANDAYNVVDAALGTVGVAASASTRMVARIYRRGKERFHTFEMSNLRIGSPIEGEYLVRKLEGGWCELDDLWATRAAKLDRDAILKVLDAHIGEWMSARSLWLEVIPRPKYGPFAGVLRDLVKEGEAREQPRQGKGSGGGKEYQRAIKPQSEQNGRYSP